MSDSIAAIYCHPGHVLLFTSVPFCFAARRAYRKPLEDVVQRALARRGLDAEASGISVAAVTNSAKSASAAAAALLDSKSMSPESIEIRRAVGSAVAGRALKVATLGSVGAFGILGSFFFYLNGYRTLEEAMTSTRNWAHQRRKQVDEALNVQNRIDRDHPEVVALRGMNDQQEMEYVSKTYLPDEDWEASAPSSPTKASTEGATESSAADQQSSKR